MKVIDKSEIIADSMIALMQKAEGGKLQSEAAFKRARIQTRAAAVANTALSNIGRITTSATNTIISAAKVSGATLDNATVVAIVKAM